MLSLYEKICRFIAANFSFLLLCVFAGGPAGAVPADLRSGPVAGSKTERYNYFYRKIARRYQGHFYLS